MLLRVVTGDSISKTVLIAQLLFQKFKYSALMPVPAGIRLSCTTLESVFRRYDNVLERYKYKDTQVCPYGSCFSSRSPCFAFFPFTNYLSRITLHQSSARFTTGSSASSIILPWPLTNALRSISFSVKGARR